MFLKRWLEKGWQVVRPTEFGSHDQKWHLEKDKEPFLSSELIRLAAQGWPLNRATHLQSTSHSEAHLVHDTDQASGEADTAQGTSILSGTRKLRGVRRAVFKP